MTFVDVVEFLEEEEPISCLGEERQGTDGHDKIVLISFEFA